MSPEAKATLTILGGVAALAALAGIVWLVVNVRGAFVIALGTFITLWLIRLWFILRNVYRERGAR